MYHVIVAECTTILHSYFAPNCAQFGAFDNCTVGAGGKGYDLRFFVNPYLQQGRLVLPVIHRAAGDAHEKVFNMM